MTKAVTTTERLGTVLKRSSETVELHADQEYREVSIRLWGKGVVLRRAAMGSELGATRRLVVRKRQFILSRIDARNGAFGLVPDELDGAVVSNDFPSFSVDSSRLQPEYLHWLSRTRWFVEQCGAASEGTTNRVRLKEERFLSISIPLPALEDQRRIVAKIERLAAKIEGARRLRERSKQATAGLPVAFTTSSLECPAMQVPRPRVGELILEAGYGTSEKCGPDLGVNTVPVLRIPNVAQERIDARDLKYAALSNADLAKARLEAGDILVVRTNGSPQLVGRSAVVPPGFEGYSFASYLIRIKPDLTRVNADYLQRCLRWLRETGELFDLARTTAGQYNVSLGRLKSAQIPLPPLPEQRRIVRHLDAVQAKVDALSSFQQQTAAELDALLPSILDRAFKGDL